jgi:hypothetical protein
VKREALQLFDGPKLLYKWLWKKELLSFLNLILCCLPIGQYSGINKMKFLDQQSSLFKQICNANMNLQPTVLPLPCLIFSSNALLNSNAK